MARKKQQLTIEEKMQQALVPQEQQPYKIPANWCWVKIGEITTVVGGGTPSSKVSEYYNGGNIAWITPADLSNYNNMYISKGKRMITKLGLEKSSARLMPKGTVCLSSRAPIGYVAIAENEISTNQGFKSFLPSEFYKSEYLYWYLKGIKHILETKASGTTFLELSAKKASEIEFPLAPLNEQQRIVDTIENLFSKLDKAKQLIQKTVDKFEQNKMAILHKAFSGELTAKWREENNLTLAGWKNVIMQDICEKIVCGKTPTGYISDKGEIPYLKVYNIVDNAINFEKTPQFIPVSIHNGKLKSSILKPNDVIMNIVGPPLRKIAIVPDSYPEWNMNQAVVRFRAKKEVIYKFIYYVLIYPKTLDSIINETKGVVGQANISISQSRNIQIKLPTIEEQQEIVKILDKIFAKYDKTKALQNQLEKIELLKKSILAKAFRGQLGTNNPSDENAAGLLQEILSHQ